ncbi:hypothetical protein OV090_03360 [Nannocystis sp. RBIL2]|uniref:hypothetical protein n=1 Tax=Nannocystis sp. RBIL2 TaxID=2996788 RepID=UPI00226FDD51|nr:hypothetical protein [Nannocystis sp. RBIL2]MCY1063782.1 hypothetical protein [Nannocystis sp. RBIL2]
MTAPDRSDPRRAWQLHGLALLALVVLYAYVFGGRAFAGPSGIFDLLGFAAVVTLEILVAYALLTTFLMLWVGRRTWGPAFMHVLLAGGYIVAVVLDDRAAEERRAEAARQHEAEQRRRVVNCLGVELRAIRGAPPRAVVELHNGCEVPLALHDVGLVGFTPAGGNVFLDPEDRDEREVTTLPPHQRATFRLVSTFPGDFAVGDGWNWRCNVLVDGPDPGIPCFATPGAPSTGGCGSFRRVALDNR